MRYFCTYFDSNYLTLGLAMYESLKRNCREFQLTILCLDEVSLLYLMRRALPECHLVSLPALEMADPELFATKGTRTIVEYYFTLTPCLVRFLLPKVPEGEFLTYLDSDLYFYSSPQPIFEELRRGSIGIVPHRFALEFEHMEQHGTFNVGWVSFRRDQEGKACSDGWRDSCLEWCYDRVEGCRYADQGYLNGWPRKFRGAIVIQHVGASVAPWNVQQYEIAGGETNVTVDGRELIFYHFHALRQVADGVFDSQLSKYGLNVTPEIRQLIYEPYLEELYRASRGVSGLSASSGNGSSHNGAPASESAFDLIPRIGAPDSEITNGWMTIEKYLYEKLVASEKDRCAKEAVILGLKRKIEDLQVWIRELNRPLKTKVVQFVPRLAGSLRRRAVGQFVGSCGMQLGKLRQYEPRKMRLEKFPAPSRPETDLPSISMVTPSFMQGQFLKRTMESVLSESYPKLSYIVQDGGSTDCSVEIIKAYESRLACWESVRDGGQADAIKRGFQGRKEDVMAWLNSDDMLMPGSLRFIGEYFAANPAVDAIYGHRVIIDENDAEVGRWVLPEHGPEILKWADYVPQETLFWRRELWNKVGGVDTSFQFAIDWDLLLKFEQVGAKIVRLPYFLGVFRVHPQQKTSGAMTNSTGDREMTRIRKSIHGRAVSRSELAPHVTKLCVRAAKTAYLLSLGIRA